MHIGEKYHSSFYSLNRDGKKAFALLPLNKNIAVSAFVIEKTVKDISKYIEIIFNFYADTILFYPIRQVSVYLRSGSKQLKDYLKVQIFPYIHYELIHIYIYIG